MRRLCAFATLAHVAAPFTARLNSGVRRQIKHRMIIFVRLINEGTTVYRPVDAKRISDELFQIIDDSQDQDEQWEFSNLDLVRCVGHVFQDGTQGLVAISCGQPAA